MTSTPVAAESPGPHPSVETAFLVPEVVLFDDRHGEVHHLNASASAVWMMIDGSSTMDEIAVELSEIFSVPVDRTRSDVATAIEDFRSRGLLDTARVQSNEAAESADGPAPVDDRRLTILDRPPNP